MKYGALELGGVLRAWGRRGREIRSLGGVLRARGCFASRVLEMCRFVDVEV